MPAFPRRLAAFAVVPLLAWGTSSSLAAAPEEIDETQRWVPSFGVVWGLFGQRADASVATSPVAGSSPPEAVRPPNSGEEALLNPFVGFSLELMTPRLSGELGRPRAFAHVDLAGALGFSYDVAKEGDPGKLRPPVIPVPEPEVSGQGSVTEARIEPVVLTSGAGIAFTCDVGGWHFRIKPSFEYIRQEVKVTGRVRRAVRLSPPPPPATLDFRFIELGGGKSQTLHGVGPGLEFELDAARIDTFVVSVFLGGMAYAMLGDRDFRLSDAQTSMAGTESASWRAELDEWLYRGVMGIRFRWLPQAGGE